MHEFAFIFRPTRAVDPAMLPQRNAAARDWALARRSDGTLRSANPLEDAGAVVAQAAVRPLATEHAVAAVLVLELPNLEAAVALAKTHPGLNYGTEIEVRQVKPVAAAPR